MQAGGLDWGEGYRPLGRGALAELIDGRMAEAVDSLLDSLGLTGMPNCRWTDDSLRKVPERIASSHRKTMSG